MAGLHMLPEAPSSGRGSQHRALAAAGMQPCGTSQTGQARPGRTRSMPRPALGARPPTSRGAARGDRLLSRKCSRGYGTRLVVTSFRSRLSCPCPSNRTAAAQAAGHSGQAPALLDGGGVHPCRCVAPAHPPTTAAEHWNMRSHAELCGGCAPEAVRFSSICAAKLFMASKGLPAMPAAAPGVWRVKAKVSLRRLECIDSGCFPSTIFQAVQCSA